MGNPNINKADKKASEPKSLGKNPTIHITSDVFQQVAIAIKLVSENKDGGNQWKKLTGSQWASESTSAHDTSDADATPDTSG